MARELSAKIVVITGASSGFGKGAARRFAEEGASLALAARRGDLLAELAAECASAGARAVPVPADVSRREDVERVAEAAVEAFGRIDVWINDAGVGALGRFERVPLEDHEQVNPSGGALAANPIMVAGLTRIAEVSDRIMSGAAGRGIAHATSGPCLQQNLVCVLAGEG